MHSERKSSVNIVLPVYNEQEELETSVHTLTAFLRKHLTDFQWTVTIADNASTDKTFFIAKNLSKNIDGVCAVHIAKKGRGKAVKQVWMQTGYLYVAYMDVDLSTDLRHLPNMLHALERGYDIAIGSRNARGARVYGRSVLRNITSKGYIALIKLFFWVHFSDAQCGFKAATYKAVRQLIPDVMDNEWFFDTELLLLAEKRGARIYEEPVTWTDNPGSTVRVMKTAIGDLRGLWRMFVTRPWKRRLYERH